MLNAPKIFFLFLLATGVLLTASFAQDVRTETVRFPRGSSGTTIEDSISGYQSVRYSLGVSAGQTLSVQLDSDNPDNYFNITAPRANEAIYNASVSGSGTSLVTASDGNYVIDVYLMRNAARRNETANYVLTLYAENAVSQQPAAPAPQSPAQNGTPSQLDTSQMPRFCVGEAAADYGVRPMDITVNMAFQSGNRMVTQGNFERDGQTTFFNCWFGLDGRFQSLN